MNLEEALVSVDFNQWKVRQVIALDWYDGPRDGLCALATPDCEFAFDLLDERFNPDDMDSRLFRLRELSSGSVDSAFQDDSDANLNRILSQSRLTNVIVHSQDFENFLGFWSLAEFPSEKIDWFTFLGIR
jgi:hypothetical protein